MHGDGNKNATGQKKKNGNGTEQTTGCRKQHQKKNKRDKKKHQDKMKNNNGKRNTEWTLKSKNLVKWGPEGWGAQNFVLSFFPSPATIFFLLSLGGPCVEFRWLKRRALKCARLEFGLSCENPGGVDWRLSSPPTHFNWHRCGIAKCALSCLGVGNIVSLWTCSVLCADTSTAPPAAISKSFQLMLARDNLPPSQKCFT